MSGLGTTNFTINKTKLIAQRTEILLQLAKLDSEIEKVSSETQFSIDDLTSFQKERGGDSNLLALRDEESCLERAEEELRTIESHFSLLSPKSRFTFDEELSEKQRIRRLNRRIQNREQKTGQVARPALKDAQAFEDIKSGNLKASTETKTVSQLLHSFQYAWNKVAGTNSRGYQDKLLKLDLDAIEDVFEAEGHLLSDNIASSCLNSLPVNQIGRHRLQDLVGWFVDAQSEPSENTHSDWQRLIKDSFKFIKLTKKRFSDALELLHHQHRIISSLSSSNPSLGQALRLAGLRLVLTPAEFPAWQRQKLLSSGSKVDIQCSIADLPNLERFGDVSTQEGAQSKPKQSTSKPVRNTTSAAKPTPSSSKRNSFLPIKSTIRFQLFMKPVVEQSTKISHQKRPPSQPTQASSRQDINPKEITPTLVLKLFPRPNPDRPLNPSEDDIEKFPDLSYSSASWICIQLRPNCSEPQAHCLRLSALHALRAIPDGHPNPFYDEVNALIFSQPSPIDPSTGEANPPPLTPQNHQVWFLLIAFLKERDALRDFEGRLPDGLLLTRAIRNIDFELRLHQTLRDIYQSSTTFENFESRLFGPQEDELGEEGMNPLRYAKKCRQKKNELNELINLCTSSPPLPRDRVRDLCRERGMSTDGTDSEVLSRLKKHLQREVDSIGFPELSKFGLECISSLFQRCKGYPHFQPSVPQPTTNVGVESISESYRRQLLALIESTPGLTFWELNEFFDTLGVETLYDYQEFLQILAANQFLTKRDSKGNQCLTLEGFRSYFDRFGRLESDIQKLAIGSLDDLLSGQSSLRMEFEPEAVSSLLNILERHSGFYPYLKNLIVQCSSLSNLEMDLQCHRISDLLKVFIQGTERDLHSYESKVYQEDSEFWNSILLSLQSPGWFSTLIHRWIEQLADNNSGFIRTLKLTVQEKFGKYHDWERAFEELIETYNIQLSEIEKGFLAAKEERKKRRELDTSLEKSVDLPDDLSLESGVEDKLQLEVFDFQQEGDSQSLLSSLDDARQILIEKGVSTFLQSLSANLPEFIDVKKIQEEIFKIQKKITFLQSVVETEEESTREGSAFTPHLRLTSSHLVSIKAVIEKNQYTLSTLLKRLDTATHLWGAHCCAFYDSLRLYGLSILSIGCGTNEICIRANFSGFNLFEFFPAARGESAPAKEFQKQRLQRSIAQKIAALTALKRERLRRAQGNMKSETDKAQIKRRESEEQQLLLELQEQLQICRMKNLDSDQIQLIQNWENFANLISNRYPQSLRSGVVFNNMFCLVGEFFGITHPKHEDCRRLLDLAAREMINSILAVNPISRTQHLDEQSVSNISLMTEDPSSSSSSEAQISTQDEPFHCQNLIELNDSIIIVSFENMSDIQKQVAILIFSNYLISSRVLSDYGHPGLSLLTWNLFDSLSAKSQDNLRRGKPLVVDQIPVFLYNPLEGDQKHKGISRFKESLEWIKVEAQKEKDRRRQRELDLLGHEDTDSEEEEEEEEESCSVSTNDRTITKPIEQTQPTEFNVLPLPSSDSSVSSVHDKKPKKRISERERDKQRSRLIRMETARKRKELYELIQTNQISKIFFEKAGVSQVNYEEDGDI